MHYRTVPDRAQEEPGSYYENVFSYEIQYCVRVFSFSRTKKISKLCIKKFKLKKKLHKKQPHFVISPVSSIIINLGVRARALPAAKK